MDLILEQCVIDQFLRFIWKQVKLKSIKVEKTSFVYIESLIKCVENFETYYCLTSEL